MCVCVFPLCKTRVRLASATPSVVWKSEVSFRAMPARSCATASAYLPPRRQNRFGIPWDFYREWVRRSKGRDPTVQTTRTVSGISEHYRSSKSERETFERREEKTDESKSILFLGTPPRTVPRAAARSPNTTRRGHSPPTPTSAQTHAHTHTQAADARIFTSAKRESLFRTSLGRRSTGGGERVTRLRRAPACVSSCASAAR